MKPTRLTPTRPADATRPLTPPELPTWCGSDVDGVLITLHGTTGDSIAILAREFIESQQLPDELQAPLEKAIAARSR